MKTAMKIIHIVGARPNFMKIAPIMEAITNYNKKCSQGECIRQILVHTGQHYDERLSKMFFHDLKIPKPDINLEVGSMSHAEQTAEIMKRFEPVCLIEKPSHVLVVGDVNSTLACTLVASKLGIKVIHVEAGLRSFDRNMPEEINRILTDAISDFLFTTEEDANFNLAREGITEAKIYLVGNVMIDTLLNHKKRAKSSNVLTTLGLIDRSVLDLRDETFKNDEILPYAVLTLHRPANVDDRQCFSNIIYALSILGKNLPIVFPVHPRTLNRIEEFGLEEFFYWDLYNSRSLVKITNGIKPIAPMGYLDFLQLMSNAKIVLTDSGGIQEETTVLGIPCVTLRQNTERPITVTQGTNVIAGVSVEGIIQKSLEQLQAPKKTTKMPIFWDGSAAKRIVGVLTKGVT